MVHEWREQDISAADISVRLELDVERVEQILAQLVDPPLPGCSRDVAGRLARRVAELERELHRSAPAPERVPGESEFRALKLHPDPEVCGCQYWRDTSRPAVEHNGRCEHAKRGT